MPAFRVFNYSIDQLVTLLAQKANTSKDAISSKAHKEYFEGYFAHLKAQTIVVEDEYIDHDYLEDFAAYYVKCFQPYERFTSRLHFFSLEFSELNFSALLSGAGSLLSQELLQEKYLGFVVVKPLPQTVIGRTCLKTYDDDPRRCYPITQEYQAHLFGIPLKVKTLAFQEQDSVVAACATSALWSCFQSTGKLFHHYIPSPVEITKVASTNIPQSDVPRDIRSLPNHGLTAAQMAYAIKHISLEPHVIGASDRHILHSTIYAYARCKIPTILGIALIDKGLPPKDENMGRHAVAVTGYSLGLTAPIPESKSGFLLRASMIDKLYAHDDQVGPFARMCHHGTHLDTSWTGEGEVIAKPYLLIIPLYNKIRIPVAYIEDGVLSFDNVLENARKRSPLPRMVWDIYLTTVNDLKEDLFVNLRTVLKDKAIDVLARNFPRFIWRATAYIDNDMQLDLLFDATGIEQQKLILLGIEYTPIVRVFIEALDKSGILNTLANNRQADAIIEQIMQDKTIKVF